MSHEHELPIDPDLASEPRSIRRNEPRVLAAIALGGALGASARYGVAQLIHVAPDTFPWATFATNITGSFALGLILATLVERFSPNRFLRPFIAIGFLGAYTTYSTFAVETDVLIKDGHAAIAVTYAGASLVVGLLAVLGGIVVERMLPGRWRST